MDTHGLSLPVGGYEESRKVYDDQRQKECIEFMAQVSHARWRHSFIDANFPLCRFLFFHYAHLIISVFHRVLCNPLIFLYQHHLFDIIFYFRLTQLVHSYIFINKHDFLFLQRHFFNM